MTKNDQRSKAGILCWVSRTSFEAWAFKLKTSGRQETVIQWWLWWLIATLLETNIIFHFKVVLKMIFLFPRLDMLVPWRAMMWYYNILMMKVVPMMMINDGWCLKSGHCWWSLINDWWLRICTVDLWYIDAWWSIIKDQQLRNDDPWVLMIEGWCGPITRAQFMLKMMTTKDPRMWRTITIIVMLVIIMIISKDNMITIIMMMMMTTMLMVMLVMTVEPWWCSLMLFWYKYGNDWLFTIHD